MLWIRLFNAAGVSQLVNFGQVMCITPAYIFFPNEFNSTIRICGGDQAKILEVLKAPAYGVNEVECEGLLDLV